MGSYRKVKKVVPQPTKNGAKKAVKKPGGEGSMEVVQGISNLAASSAAGKDEFTPVASKVTSNTGHFKLQTVSKISDIYYIYDIFS